MDNLIVWLVLGAIVWFFQIVGATRKNRGGRKEPQRSRESSNDAGSSPQDELRKFLQSLQGTATPAPASPPASKKVRVQAPPPVPAQTQPTEVLQISAKDLTSKRRIQPRNVIAFEGLPDLTDPEALRTAILLREILGPPVALRRSRRRTLK